MRKPDYNRRVVVTGLGVVSPIGNDTDTVWASLTSGKSGIGSAKGDGGKMAENHVPVAEGNGGRGNFTGNHFFRAKD